MGPPAAATEPSGQRTKLDERVGTCHGRDGVAPVAAAVVARELVHKARVDLLQVQERQALGEAAVRERQVAHAILQQVATAATQPEFAIRATREEQDVLERVGAGLDAALGGRPLVQLLDDLLALLLARVQVAAGVANGLHGRHLPHKPHRESAQEVSYLFVALPYSESSVMARAHQQHAVGDPRHERDDRHGCCGLIMQSGPHSGNVWTSFPEITSFRLLM